jgi:predicted MFS family arabinose efflux permease
VTSERTSFADVLRVKEFRWLWLAGVQSQVGDQLARVALSVLVFERTGSALQTALVYALTFVPALVGATTLSWLADRLPRRQVMIGCDIGRALLLSLMALPHLSIVALSALLVAAVLTGAPFSAAQVALLPDILGERFVAGSGLRMMSDQLTQVLGFALGGAAVAAIGARAGLLVDGCSFALSAVIIAAAVRSRPVPSLGRHAAPEPRGAWAAVRVIVSDGRLRSLLALGWLAGFYIVPEAVAAPYAKSIGTGTGGVGLLLASIPLGGAAGAWILVRWVPRPWREHLVAPLAVAAGLPLLGCWWSPGLAVSAILWALSGAASAYQVVAATSFVRLVPDSMRGRCVGVAAGGLLAIQGLGALAGGYLGEHVGMGEAVALAGLVGASIAAVFGVAWSWAAQRQSATEVPEIAGKRRLSL